MVIVFGLPRSSVLVGEIKEDNSEFKERWVDFKKHNNASRRCEICFYGQGKVIETDINKYYVIVKSPFGNIMVLIDYCLLSESEIQVLDNKNAYVGGVFELLMEKAIPHTVHNPSFAEALRYSLATDDWGQKSVFFKDKRIEFDLKTMEEIPELCNSLSGLRLIGKYLYSNYSKVNLSIIRKNNNEKFFENQGINMAESRFMILVSINKEAKYIIEIQAGISRLERVAIREYKEYEKDSFVTVKEFGEYLFSRNGGK